jgi:hypothetical protein
MTTPRPPPSPTACSNRTHQAAATEMHDRQGSGVRGRSVRRGSLPPAAPNAAGLPCRRGTKFSAPTHIPTDFSPRIFYPPCFLTICPQAICAAQPASRRICVYASHRSHFVPLPVPTHNLRPRSAQVSDPAIPTTAGLLPEAMHIHAEKSPRCQKCRNPLPSNDLRRIFHDSRHSFYSRPE